MGLAFNRFLDIVVDRVTTRTATIALYSLLGVFVLLCVVLALT
jgi:hypothetical protein